MSPPVLLALPDLSPPLVVEILPTGLTVNRFLVNADGKTHDLVVGPANPADHGLPAHKYQNTIIGRYTNRLPAAPMTVEKDGTNAPVHPTPNANSTVSLHGGPEGFDTREWQPIDISMATLFSDSEKSSISALPASAIFTLVSPDGDQGFPGKLLLEVLFAVSSAVPKQNTTPSEPYHVGSLYVVYRARLLSERTKQVTPLNLTQHWGFNLDASLAKKGTPTPDIKEHRLFIKADHTIALDEHALSTGKLIPVAGTPQEHSRTRLGDSFPLRGHDSFYLFNAPSTPIESIRLPLSKLSALDLFRDVLHAPARTGPLVELSSERSGLTLAFDSNQPGVQFYSANFFEGKGTRKPIHGGSGKQGDGYDPQTFAFLEFHEPLAAWLHPETAVSGDTLLTSDELYNNFVRVDVLFKRPPHSGEDDE